MTWDLWGYDNHRVASTAEVSADDLKRVIDSYRNTPEAQRRCKADDAAGWCEESMEDFIRHAQKHGVEVSRREFNYPLRSAFPTPHRSLDWGFREPDEDQQDQWDGFHYAPVVNVQGTPHVVDWTMSQLKPDAQFPHIEPLDSYGSRFSYHVSYEPPYPYYDDDHHTAAVGIGVPGPGERTAEWDEAAARQRLQEFLSKMQEQANGLQYVTPQPGKTLAVGPNWSGSVPEGHPSRIPRQAEQDDIHGYLDHDDDGHVNFVYTAPAMRGFGVGTKLLDHAGITDMAHASRFTSDGQKFHDALERKRHAHRTAMPTWHHLTDDPHFSLDSGYEPVNLNDTGDSSGSGRLGPGVFLTQRPQEWATMPPPEDAEWSAERPYIADIDAPDDLHMLPGVWHDPHSTRPTDKFPGSDEIFVPADQFHHLKVKQVRPRTAMPAAYHYTEDPDFEPDNWSYPNKYDPETPEGPGIFVAPEEHGEDWSDYGPYRAEFHSPHDLANHPDVWTPKLPSGERFPMEMFVPGHLFNQWEYKGLQKMPRTKKARIMTAAVTVYTKPSCPQCDMTKKLLDRLGVEHDTVDVTADPEAHAYVTGLGYQAAPVVVVGDGEDHWGGFKVDRLKGLAQ